MHTGVSWIANSLEYHRFVCADPLAPSGARYNSAKQGQEQAPGANCRTRNYDIEIRILNFSI
jgi:hypothetical protein